MPAVFSVINGSDGYVSHPSLMTCIAGALLSLVCVWTFPVQATEASERMRVWFDKVPPSAEAEFYQIKDGIARFADQMMYETRSEPGFENYHYWDLYWTSGRGCSQTYGKPLRDLQQVNCLWGAVDMTRKNLFFRLLRAAFGTQLASSINPMTYFLPEDYFDAAAYIHGQNPPPAVVLKSETHRAQGVHIVPARAALAEALRQGHKPRSRRIILAQKLVQDQLLVKGRPFLIRVWFLVCGPDPIRLYVFKGGSVIFGTKQPLGDGRGSPTRGTHRDVGAGAAGASAAPSAVQHEQGGTVDEGPRSRTLHGGGGGEGGDGEPSAGTAWGDLVVNLWTEDKEAARALATRLSVLEAHVVRSVGQPVWDAMWRQAELAIAAAVAATVPSMRRGTAVVAARRATAAGGGKRREYPGDLGGFMLLGADVVLDSRLTPWVIEINQPSIKPLIMPGPHGAGAAAEPPGGGGGGSSGGGAPPGAEHPCDEQRRELLDGMLQVLHTRHREGVAALRGRGAGSGERSEVNAPRDTQAGVQEGVCGAGGEGGCAAGEGTAGGAASARQGSGVAGSAGAPEASAHSSSTRAVREATVRMALREAATAAAHNFSVLTPRVYQALECMAGGKGAGSGQSPPCPALQELLRAPAPSLDWQQIDASLLSHTGVRFGDTRGTSTGARPAHTGGPAGLTVLSRWLSRGARGVAARASRLGLPAFVWGPAPPPKWQPEEFSFSDSDLLFLSAMNHEAREA